MRRERGDERREKLREKERALTCIRGSPIVKPQDLTHSKF